jgi:enolase-phosphatase E1
MTFSLAAEGVRAILLDIEGTTTPISFVYDVLFPFARAHVQSFLEKEFESADVQHVIGLLRLEHTADSQQQPPPPILISGTRSEEISSLVAYVNWLMDRDRKSTGLKSLQGKIWELGYRDRLLQAEVFADVAPSLERWREAGILVGIFSSGSILAQKLLFAHTNKGNLTTFIEHYFDTTIGPKNREESYRAISDAVGMKPTEMLFISDVTQELDAAQASGMHTLLCVRPGNHPQPDPPRFQIIRSFDEVV